MENKYFVAENLNEFAKRGRPKKSKMPEPGVEDEWYNSDDEFDADVSGPEQIEDVSIEDEVSDSATYRQFIKMVDNELKIPEFSRAKIDFILRSTREPFSGIPLTKLSGGEAILFKTKNGMKKVKLDDIIFESFILPYNKPKKFVGESINYYAKD